MSEANTALATLTNERPKFLQFLRARVSQPDDAEEILQRASMKILERGSALRNDASAEAWIYRLLRNELTDHYRRTTVNSKRMVELPPNLDQTLAAPATEQERLCPCAVAELTTLLPDYSDALRSIEMSDESIQSHAARKKISLNNATVRLHRARKALRTRVQARCGQCAGAGCFNCNCS